MISTWCRWRARCRRRGKFRAARALVEIVAEKLHAAHEKLLKAVRSQRFHIFLVDLVRWIEDGAWLKAELKDGDGPVARFARIEIARRRKRLLKRADHLSEARRQRRGIKCALPGRSCVT